MAEIYKFFNSAIGDPRKYQASDFASYFGSVLSTGLLSVDGLPTIQVKTKGNDLRTYVTAGKALMQGYPYENTGDLYLTHALTETTMDRIDRVVLRLDKRNQSRFIKAFIIQGVAATNPVPPSLTRDDNIYEISLAQVRVRANTASLLVTDVIDERFNEDLCGLVYSLISIPTTQFQEQWDNWFKVTETYEQQFNDWFEGQQSEGFVTQTEFDNEVKGLNVQKTTLNNGVNTVTSAEKAPINVLSTKGKSLMNLLPILRIWNKSSKLTVNDDYKATLVTTAATRESSSMSVWNVKPGETYYVQGTVTSSTGVGGRIFADLYTAAGVYVSTFLAGQSFVVPANVAYVNFGIDNAVAGTGGFGIGTYVFEGLSFHKGSAPQQTVVGVKGIVNPTVQVKSNASTTGDFSGKIVGSNVENPHDVKHAYQSTLQHPTTGTFVAQNQGNIDNVKTLDGMLYRPNVNTNGVIAHVVFSLNLIEHVERKYKKKIPSSNKVQWLKDNILYFNPFWSGRGSGPNGYKATFSIFRFDTNVYYGNIVSTSSVISKLSIFATAEDIRVALDSNGRVHLLAYADPSNGTTASTIETDHFSFDVELKPDCELLVNSREVIETTLHSLNGVDDELVVNDGVLRKVERVRELIADGSLAWEFGGDYVGYKALSVRATSAVGRGNTYYGVKPDGKILHNYAGSYASADVIWNDPSNGWLTITVSDFETGWSEAWTGNATSWATPEELIKIYFNGWLYVSGQAKDAWRNIYKPEELTMEKGTCLARNTHKENGKEGYKLIYSLANERVREIPTKGQAVLEEGANIVELKQGIIVREKANPMLSTAYGWYINNLALPDSLLKNRVGNILKLYKNGIEETRYTLDKVNANGKYCIFIEKVDYDPNATYFVDYEILPEATVKAEPVTIDYAQNIKSLVDIHTDKLKQLEVRFDTLGTAYARREQDKGIDLPTTNGWVRDPNRGFKLYLEDSGWATIVGGLQNGVSNNWVVFTNLPMGVAPIDGYVTNVVGCNANNAYNQCHIRIDQDRSVKLTANLPGTITELFINVRFKYR
jgi:hypothetical protein